MKILLVLIILLISFSYCFSQTNGWEDVEKVFGKKGSVQDGVFKVTYPRTDFKVKIGDFAISPGLALTSWVGFIKMGNETTMMGDMVLLDKEVHAVLSKLVSENLLVTAIHNHLLNETPAVKYIHFSGKGNAVALGKEIITVLSVTGTPLGQEQKKTPPALKPDWSKVESILGNSGKENGELLQYNFPRNDKLTEGGMHMPPAIGMATSVNFQMDDKRAGISGDFVLIADEVNPVVKALTDNGIVVTAIHNHMLYDNPRLFMMHYWAVGDPAKLAKGIKAALEKTNSKLRNK